MPSTKIFFEMDKKSGKTEKYFTKMSKFSSYDFLNNAGKIGVSLLSEATPKDTGITAASWTYEIIKKDKDTYDLYFKNTNTVNGIPIVLLLQYGHATGGGGYVSPIDFVNPVTKQLQMKLSADIWREVTE